MNFKIQNNLKNIFSGSNRTQVVKKNILGSFVIKGLSILITLLLVPLTINLLDQEKYGIWMTLFSIVSWFNMMDMGLGNGFRNRFAEAVAINNLELAKEYVQTFYSSMGIIAFAFFLLFSIINPVLNWNKILNLPPSFDENISLIIWIVFGLFCVQLYVKNISTLLLSLQKTTYSNALLFFANITTLVFILLLQRLSVVSLFSIALAFMLAPILVYTIVTIVLFKNNFKKLKPSFLYLPKRKYLNDLVGLGIKFFLIQISTIVIYSSSNIIISQLYGPAEVTPYNVAFRFYSSVQIFFTIIITPFWTAFTEANAKKDYSWIKNSLKKLIYIWMIFSLGVIVLWLISPHFFKIWVGTKVHIPYFLSLQFAIFIIINTWTSIFSFFVAGISKVSLSFYVAIFQLVIYVPLALFLARSLNFNTSGIIMATNFVLLIPAVLLTIQTKKNIDNKAYGIWNR